MRNGGCVKMEAFVLVAFFPLFHSNCLPNLRAIPMITAVVVSLRFPLFYRPTFVLFKPENGLFRLPKHSVLKENGPILKRKILQNWEK